MNEAGQCPKCKKDRNMSGDSESYVGNDEYTTQYYCDGCKLSWLSYFKFDRQEVDEE